MTPQIENLRQQASLKRLAGGIPFLHFYSGPREQRLMSKERDDEDRAILNDPEK